MTFTTTKLVGSRVLVKGTDVFGVEGQTILDSTQWDEVNAHREFDQAADAFDAAVTEFFAPILEAAEKMNRKVEATPDPVSYVVLHEAVEAVPGQPGQLVKLNHDSIVLRLIEQNAATARLVWVGDELEILEADVVDTPLPVPVQTVDTVDSGAGSLA